MNNEERTRALMQIMWIQECGDYYVCESCRYATTFRYSIFRHFATKRHRKNGRPEIAYQFELSDIIDENIIRVLKFER